MRASLLHSHPILIHSSCLSVHSCLQSPCALDHSPNAFALAQVRCTENVRVIGHTVPTRPEALLYVFEDYEAVIKMIIKGRSPTMRHVSRTHRVALDWLFDRINLDSKIQIKYIDTKNQLADILTNGNFTCDE